MGAYYLSRKAKLGTVMDIKWTLDQKEARLFLNEGNVKGQNTILRNSGYDTYIIQSRVVDERCVE